MAFSFRDNVSISVNLLIDEAIRSLDRGDDLRYNELEQRSASCGSQMTLAERRPYRCLDHHT